MEFINKKRQKMIEDLSEECQKTEAELATHVGNLGVITSQVRILYI